MINGLYCFTKIVGLKLRLSIIFSFFLASFAAFTCMPVNAENSGKINILFIFSWHKNMPWQIEVEKGFEEHFKAKSPKPNLFYEYMDAGRFKKQNQIDIFNNYLKKKYEGYQINYVIYESWAAAQLFKSYPGLLENSEKYVINPGTIMDSSHSYTSTVIPVNIDYERAAKELLAVSKGKTIYLIAGATTMGKERAQKFSKLLLKFEPGKKVIPLIGLPMNQLLDKVSNLGPNNIIYYLLIFRDGEGVRYIPYDAATHITHQASVPVYSYWTSLLGSGIVGGYMLSGELVGEKVASILMNSNLDKNTDSKKLTEKFHGFFYDWRQLKRWDIEEDLLPSDSRILFKEPTFYEHYYHEIIAGSLTIILLISFFWNRRLKREIKERQKVEENLQMSEKRFRSLSDASFEGIFISDKGKILDVNKAAAVMFGYSATELVGMEGTSLICPEDRDEVLNKMLSGYEKPYEIFGLKKDGIKFPMEAHAKMYSFKGQQVRVTALRDLTEKKKAEEEIKTLKGILPICAHCKKIRDDKGYWSQLETYIRNHSMAEFSHGICPECKKKLYPDFDISE